MNRGLIISPFLEQRIKLQRVLEYMPAFLEVDSAHSLDEAETSFLAKKKMNFVFIADHFEESAIAEFISRTKKSAQGKDTAFIMLHSSNLQNKDTIANQMILGFHGFLFEPYSEASILEVVSLSGRVKQQQSNARLKAATGLMLTDTIAEINGENEEEASHLDTWQKVKHSCEEYKKITGESLTLAVVGALDKMGSSARLPSYTGASRRVRSLLKEKMKLRLRKGKDDDAGADSLLPPEPPALQEE